MRILWQSASPFCQTGYGMQTSIATRRIKAMGHDLAIFAYAGLEGSEVQWGDIPIFPNPHKDYGVTDVKAFYDYWQADIVISLIDIWVLAGMDASLRWCPWTPIDHQPTTPLVEHVLKTSVGLLKPIAMSKFGQAEMAKINVDSYYIPHSINTNIFAPRGEWRKVSRERYNWQDKFVIGTVGVNNEERKNYSIAMQGVKLFASKHNDVVYYMHTNPFRDSGFNLDRLRKSLGLEDITFFPSRVEAAIGISTETLSRMYNALDVFLLPSKGEGFGLPTIEAQSCAVPVILADNTTSPELLGGGWLLKDQTKVYTHQDSWKTDSNPQEIAEVLEQAYQAKKDGSIEELRAKARLKALEYDEEKVYSEYWPPVLADIEKRLKEPMNCEGVAEFILHLIPQSCNPAKVLDIGCGVHLSYRPHLQRLGEYVGIDTRSATGVTVMDAHNLKFRDKEFGFVWCVEVLEHCQNPAKVLREAKRVGVHGAFVFSTPESRNFKADPTHKEVKLKHATLSGGDGIITW